MAGATHEAGSMPVMWLPTTEKLCMDPMPDHSAGSVPACSRVVFKTAQTAQLHPAGLPTVLLSCYTEARLLRKPVVHQQTPGRHTAHMHSRASIRAGLSEPCRTWLALATNPEA